MLIQHSKLNSLSHLPIFTWLSWVYIVQIPSQGCILMFLSLSFECNLSSRFRISLSSRWILGLPLQTRAVSTLSSVRFTFGFKVFSCWCLYKGESVQVQLVVVTFFRPCFSKNNHFLKQYCCAEGKKSCIILVQVYLLGKRKCSLKT